jgi:hypothetical protein
MVRAGRAGRLGAAITKFLLCAKPKRQVNRMLDEWAGGPLNK